MEKPTKPEAIHNLVGGSITCVGDDVTYVDYSTQLSCKWLQELVNSLEDQYVDDNTDFDVDKHISELLNGPARS